MPRFALLFSYVGSPYCGWQSQAEASGPLPSIQTTLHDALKLLGERDSKPPFASGRTDSGVHAEGQVAHVDLIRNWNPRNLVLALNSVLPPSIRILNTVLVSDDFHAQKSCISKTYAYRLCLGIAVPAMDADRSWLIPYSIDPILLQNCLKLLKGTHDFKAFQGSGSSPDITTVRTVFEAQIRPATDIGGKSNFMELWFTGNGFLKQMVRSLVGTLVDISRGTLPPDHLKHLLTSKSRADIGQTAPAHGLRLVEVHYDPTIVSF